MTAPDALPLQAVEITPRPESALSRPQETVIPRPGESMTAAIFRVYDPHHGDGTSEMDRMLYNIRDHERALAAARCELAARHASETADLRQQLADARDELTSAHELNASLQQDLEDATCAALSAA